MEVILFPTEAPYVGDVANPRPIIAVEIVGEFPFLTTALVDSGADFSIFQADYAEFAGVGDIARGSLQQISGISGETGMIGYRHLVPLVIAGRRLQLPIVFAPLPEGVPNILGRDGIFGIGPIGFDEPRRRVLFPFEPD